MGLGGVPLGRGCTFPGHTPADTTPGHTPQENTPRHPPDPHTSWTHTPLETHPPHYGTHPNGMLSCLY